MQRRVAAIYLVFFVLMGASAYTVIGMAQQPAVDIPNGETYGNEDTFSAGGQQYLVRVGVAESEGGGHGGGGGASPVGNLTYVNDSARQTATWASGDVVTYQGTDYNVTVDANASTPRVELVEVVNVTATLRNDSAVYNETVVINGTESVTYREDNRNRPLDEYIAEQYPDRRSVSFVEGDEVEYDNQTTTLSTIAEGEATLTWTSSEERQIELTEGGNVTLADGNTYFAHFDTHGEPTVVLAPQSEYGAYQGDLARQDYFGQRMNGLWGVVILSGFAGFLIISLAYMPVRG